MLSTLAILGSIIGGAGLILLSVFDTKRHHNLHRIFLLVFIIGVALSAIFTIAEVRGQSMTCFKIFNHKGLSFTVESSIS